MITDRVMRRALGASAVFNLGGALLFAFPASPLGQFAGLPIAVPPLYCTLVAFFVLLFGGAYAWLARQPSIDRPLVAFAAFGKSGFFAVMVVFWLLGETSGRGVLGASGDLAFAGLFFWWLRSTSATGRASSKLAAARPGVLADDPASASFRHDRR